MKKRLFLIFLLLLPIAAFAQGSSPSQTPVVSNGAGQPIPDASVAICTSDPGPNPVAVCTGLVPTYTSGTLGTPCTGIPGTQPLNNRVAPLVGTGCSNPGLADINGNVIAFTAAGTYYCEFYGPTIAGFISQPCIAPSVSGGGGLALQTNGVANGSQALLNLIGGTNITLTDNGVGGITISASGGGAGNPAGLNTQGQYNNAGVFGATATPWLPNVLSFNNTTGKLTLDAVNSVRYVTTDYNWSQSPAGTVSIGANTVTLSPSPAGIQVIGAPWQPFTYVHLGAVGTPEDVLVTATTCALIGGAGSCTITFTAANAHGAGFTVGSSSSGIQEAINAGNFIQTDYTRAGDSRVIIPPGEYTATATFSMPSFAPQYLEGYGAVVTCNMSAHCLFVGDSVNANLSGQKVVEGLTFRPGVANSSFSAIADNSQHTFVTHIQPAIVKHVLANSFGHLYLALDDESAVVDNLDTTQNYNWSHCSTDFCSSAIATTPGLATVLTVQNSNLSMQCSGNGIDYQSGNTLSVINTVMQGFAQFGVRSNAGFSNFPSGGFFHDYWEAGSGCINPMYGASTGASAGLIVEGGFATIQASNGPAGHFPNFVNTGGTIYNYYAVTHNTTAGVVSAPFLLGTALTNGAGNITITWPQQGTAGVVTYDIIRTSGNLLTTPFPYTANCGGGTPTTCGSVTTALAQAAACLTTIDSIVMCSFVDNAAANTTAYTVAVPTYNPGVTFWPGSIAYIGITDSTGTSPSPGNGIFMDVAGANIASSTVPATSVPMISTGTWLPRIFAQQCGTLPAGTFAVCLDSQLSASQGGATLLWNGIYNAPNLTNRKGRLNFMTGIYNGGVISPGEILTLIDSAPAKTLATPNFTPVQDAADTYFANDTTVAVVNTSAQLAIGAPVSQSRYINSTPDNTSWKERLTASAETYTVAVTAPKYNTTSNCTAVGTAANPSVVACGSASSGAVACDAAASGGTCQINTTAVTAKSRIQITINTAEGADLGITCNTTPTALPAVLYASKIAGASLTLNVPTIAGNPACYDFLIIN